MDAGAVDEIIKDVTLLAQGDYNSIWLVKLGQLKVKNGSSSLSPDRQVHSSPSTLPTKSHSKDLHDALYISGPGIPMGRVENCVQRG